jgi:hypothetical protein
VFTPLICFIRITPVFSSDLFYQNHPCVPKQIRGVNTEVILIKQIRGEHRGDSDKTNQRSEHRGESDKTNQRNEYRGDSDKTNPSDLFYQNHPCVLITPLICFIRITPLFSPDLFY